MAGKGVVSAGMGMGVVLLMGAAYFAAPYAGIKITLMFLTLAAAVAALGASVSLLTLTILSRPEKKKPADARKLRELKDSAFARFPAGGVRVVVKPDMKVSDLGVVRHPEDYTEKPVLVTIKKSSGSAVFNPIVLKQLFTALRSHKDFVHILLVNEHDEYIGYLPAAYARVFMIGDDAETQISRYIIDVLANPNASVNLREISNFTMAKCIGLSKHECISDEALVSEAMKKLTENHVRGLVVYKGNRIRKPFGVIWDEDLVKLVLDSAKS